MPPMMVMTSDTTAAKIGRSMKKRLILMGVLPTGGAQRRRASFLCLRDGPPGRRCGRRRHLALGGHLAAGTGALQAAHDHPVLGGDALAHDTHALVHGSELDVAARHDAVRADGV